jgi:hypothetical protein
VVVTVGKQSFVSSRNGQPPIAKTGCIFQGSFVTDDAGAPSNLRWSIPGDPEAFPTLYYLPIETPANDKITYIGMVNNVCVVGLTNAIVRLNYLPTEDDASFTRTRIYDFITRDLGIVNAKAATTFLAADGRELLACITQGGVYVTDGFTFTKWDADYTFRATIIEQAIAINPYDPLSLCITNDPSTGNLYVAYSATAGGGTIKIVPFNYSARHLKSGPRFKIGLPFTGPANAQVVSTHTRNLTGQHIAYFGFNGASSSTIANVGMYGVTSYLAKANSSIMTRSIPLGIGAKESIVNMVYLHANDSTPITIYAVSNLPDDTATYTSATHTLAQSKIASADFQFNSYQTYFVLGVASTASVNMRQLYIDVDPWSD